MVNRKEVFAFLYIPQMIMRWLNKMLRIIGLYTDNNKYVYTRTDGLGNLISYSDVINVIIALCSEM